jgi:hypothetical protein
VFLFTAMYELNPRKARQNEQKSYNIKHGKGTIILFLFCHLSMLKTDLQWKNIANTIISG